MILLKQRGYNQAIFNAGLENVLLPENRIPLILKNIVSL